jgi:hypothetical protein
MTVIAKEFDYPALYETAGQMSGDSQWAFLLLIRGEYLALILAAILSMEWSKAPAFFVVYALVLLVSLSLLIARTYLKPEQGWYRGRALAESIKTSCWRYCMRAEPFADALGIDQPKAELRSSLLEILKANRFIGDRMPPDSAAKEQVPESMDEVRRLSIEDRKAYYIEHRIKEQRKWYAIKAGKNKRASRNWSFIGIAAYGVAISLAMSRIAWPLWSLWPIDPVLVFASAVIGWTQVKKFNELASSYTLTAHEIGLTQGRIATVVTENELSDFVNDTEQAFSREHTQWVARSQA